MKSQQGVDVAQDIRTERQAEEAGTAVQESSFGTILTGQSVVVRKNSAGAEVTQPRLNLIEGSNVAVTLADDPVGSEADITFALVASPNVTSLKVGGTKVVGAQGAAVADAAGGAVIDVEARAALNALLAELRAATGHGLIA